MDITLHCPSCDTLIQVPATAVGRPCRCERCQQTFVVPEQDGPDDDMFSSWIEEDVEQFTDLRHHEMEDLIESNLTAARASEDEAPAAEAKLPEMEILEEDAPSRRRSIWPTRRKGKKTARHGKAWEELPSVLRKRLNQWCQVRVGELFDLYLPDADLAREDAGKAGLILTDQRMIYCRYHHRGQAERSDASYTILCKQAGPECHLTLAHGNQRDPMVHLLKRHVQRLSEKLAGDALRIVSPNG